MAKRQGTLRYCNGVLMPSKRVTHWYTYDKLQKEFEVFIAKKGSFLVSPETKIQVYKSMWLTREGMMR